MEFNVEWKKEDYRAILPHRAHPTDAGCDVFAIDAAVIAAGSDHLFSLGWSCAVPEGYALIVKEKSGRATKDKLDVGACVIDSSYRGIVHVHLFNNGHEDVIISAGEKIAQLILVPVWLGSFVEVNELNITDRGKGGFGSTGLYESTNIDSSWVDKRNDALREVLPRPVLKKG